MRCSQVDEGLQHRLHAVVAVRLRKTRLRPRGPVSRFCHDTRELTRKPTPAPAAWLALTWGSCHILASRWKAVEMLTALKSLPDRSMISRMRSTRLASTI